MDTEFIDRRGALPDYEPKPKPKPTPKPPAPKAPPKLSCKQCGGAMRKWTRSSGNALGILVGLMLVFIGLAITILIPMLGWIGGPILMLIGLFSGGKREKFWKCESCSAIVPRA